MARRASSRRWLDRQASDPFVKQAQAAGYRSRAAFKLLAIQERDRILAAGQRVLDLGSAPGSWSQVAAKLAGPAGQVIALDRLPMAAVPGVIFIQGDFQESSVIETLNATLAEAAVDVVLSDMAPNFSGIESVDQPRAMILAELAFELACERLKPQGALVVKVFQGTGFDAYLRLLRARFQRVGSRKPAASRSPSREVYLVGKGFHP